MKKYIVIGRPRAGSLIAEFLLTAANVEYEFKNISIEEAQQNEFKSISPFFKNTSFSLSRRADHI